MTITYVSTTPLMYTVVGTASARSLPAGWQPGDLLIMASVGGPNPPAGWTELGATVTGGTGNGNFTGTFSVFYRFAEVGDSVPAATQTPSTSRIAAYRGVGSVGDGALLSGASFSNPPVPAATAPLDAVQVATAMWGPPEDITYSAPSGMTDRSAGAGFDADAGFVVFADRAVTAGPIPATSWTAPAASKDAGASIILLPGNLAPNAPSLTAPVGGTVVNREATRRFSWAISDPNPGDTQSAYSLRYRVDGDASWTTVSASTPNSYRDFPAGTFVGTDPVDYEWQVRTTDAGGLTGPYSASSFFTAVTPPDGPTITAPTAGATIPIVSALLEWSTPEQDAYEVRVLADLAGEPDESTVLFATGTIEVPGLRSQTVPLPDNLVTRHLQVRTRFDGLWSPWSSVDVMVSFTGPAIPTVTVLGSDADALIAVTVGNPTPVGDEPFVDSNEVWRRKSLDGSEEIRLSATTTPNGTFLDRTPAHLVDYEYRALAVGANSTTTWSEWVGGTTVEVTLSEYGDGY